MDILVTIIRFPVAVIASIVIVVFWVVIFPIELVLVIVTFPIAAIVVNRSTVNAIYGGFPYSLPQIPKRLRTVWDWISSEEKGVFDSCGCLIVIGILALIAWYYINNYW